MKIIVSFLNGNNYWQQKVLASAEQASRALSDPAFIAKVRAIPRFDFTSDSPGMVADRIEQAGVVSVPVSFYCGWWWSKAIAFEDKNGVHFNTRKEAYGAGGPGDLAHELMHQLGYQHNGNSPSGNLGTVPYLIGSLVERWIKGVA